MSTVFDENRTSHSAKIGKALNTWLRKAKIMNHQNNACREIELAAQIIFIHRKIRQDAIKANVEACGECRVHLDAAVERRHPGDSTSRQIQTSAGPVQSRAAGSEQTRIRAEHVAKRRGCRPQVAPARVQANSN